VQNYTDKITILRNGLLLLQTAGIVMKQQNNGIINTLGLQANNLFQAPKCV